MIELIVDCPHCSVRLYEQIFETAGYYNVPTSLHCWFCESLIPVNHPLYASGKQLVDVCGNRKMVTIGDKNSDD